MHACMQILRWVYRVNTTAACTQSYGDRACLVPHTTTCNSFVAEPPFHDPPFHDPPFHDPPFHDPPLPLRSTCPRSTEGEGSPRCVSRGCVWRSAITTSARCGGCSWACRLATDAARGRDAISLHPHPVQRASMTSHPPPSLSSPSLLPSLSPSLPLSLPPCSHSFRFSPPSPHAHIPLPPSPRVCRWPRWPCSSSSPMTDQT